MSDSDLRYWPLWVTAFDLSLMVTQTLLKKNSNLYQSCFCFSQLLNFFALRGTFVAAFVLVEMILLFLSPLFSSLLLRRGPSCNHFRRKRSTWRSTKKPRSDQVNKLKIPLTRVLPKSGTKTWLSVWEKQLLSSCCGDSARWSLLTKKKTTS